ncbi:MAG: DUF255 domain-containing protein [Saprospiraceae bacterium]
MKTTNLYFAQIFFVLAVMLSVGCKSKKQVTRTNDRITKVNTFAFDFLESPTLIPILDRAIDEDKLIFVDIYTSWCLPCKMMDKDVFSHQETANVINKDFISYKVNGEKLNGPDLTAIFEVSSYPTLLFLDTKGRVLAKKSGLAYHTELLALAQSAKDKYDWDRNQLN